MLHISLFQVVLTWVLFLPFPIINGIVREKVYRQFVGELLANRISTVILIVLFLLYIYIVLGSKLSTLSSKELWIIGFEWVIFTVIFEFLFGHYGDHVSWQKLLENFNVFKGNWWDFFLLFQLFSPFIVKFIRSH